MADFFFFFFDEETGKAVPIPVDEHDIEYSEELEFIFNEKVRKVWIKQKGQLFLSVADVISVLTESTDPKQYIKKLRSRDPELNARWGTICTLTPMQASDGKTYRTNSANIEGILRIIQSIPSKKAEPFKQWLAKVGRERLDEIADPELSFERMIRTYREKGYSETWIKQRLQSINIRKGLTDEWNRSGIKDSNDYGILTNILTKAWSGKTVQEYKEYKGLRKESLRDNMTNLELTLNQLAEVSATALSQAKSPKGMTENKAIAKEGGSIAGNARRDLESKIGRSIISPLNANDVALLDDSEE